MTLPPEPEVAASSGPAPWLAGRPAGRSRQTRRLGVAGLAISGVSVAATGAVAALGPSIMEPALLGTAGQPPWALAARPSPYLAVALTITAILAGLTGLTFTFNALRRGWRVSPRLILAAGIIAAFALAFLPPFGSADHLSYAAYGRMVLTGHDPYTTTPAALARLGDPVARAVQDWRDSPSVYGSLAVALQAFAARVGGGSMRGIVFVLSLLNAAAFAATGLLLHWTGRGDAGRQLRAAVAWTANPLLLLILVSGAHVDSQAIVFGVAAVAVAVAGLRPGVAGDRTGRLALIAAGAGALAGLGFAIKVTTALVGAGLAIGIALTWRGRSTLRRKAAILGGLAAGFCAAVAASLIPWGTGMLGPALRAGSYTSVGSPWRPVRSALRLLLGENAAETAIKAGALLLAAGLLALLLRRIRHGGLRAGGPRDGGSRDGGSRYGGSRYGGPQYGGSQYGGSQYGGGELLAACGFAVVFAWLLAWPYVLPWYDGLGWALLALLPASRLDWLMLARTAALAIGYLPARTAVVLPAGLRWLETVVRTAITPAALLGVVAVAIVWLWPGRPAREAAP